MNWPWKDRIAFGPSGGGGGGSQTVTNVQQIPQFEQDFAHENQDLARSLGSQPYPLYQGELVAGFSPTQQAGQQMAVNAANSFQPGLNAANAATMGALGIDPMGYGQPAINAGMNATMGALNSNPMGYGQGAINAGLGMMGSAYAGNPANPGVVQSYMSPFVQAALAPQITALNEQLGQQQKQIDTQATGANAFGDARHGAQSALANFYGNQSMNGLLAGGYNTAYANALQTAQGQQQLALQGGQQMANVGLGQIGAGIQEQGLGLQGGNQLSNLGLGQIGAGIQSQGMGLQGASQLGNLAQLQQSLGLQGANAVYDVGQQQQQQQQQALNTAYQQYQNQVQYPYQQLNTRLSALSNSPYNHTSQVTLPGANSAASNLGTFASLAGLLGGGLSGGGSVPPFGGAAYNPSSSKVG